MCLKMYIFAVCLYKILCYGKEFFDICCGFYLVSKEYHEITIMEMLKNMKIQQYFFCKFKKHLYCRHETKTPPELSVYVTSQHPFCIALKHVHHYCK